MSLGTTVPLGTSVPPTQLPVTPLPAMRHGDINLAHLNFLTEPILVNGKELGIVHIYSEAPKYQWVDASGEGISALDDVDMLTFESTGTDPARSAIVDAFVVLPVVERKVLTDSAGHSVVVAHSLKTGETTLEEK